MDKISFEIGIRIASLIGLQRDVASMCLVSSQWLEAARPILYKKLKLRYGSYGIQDTLRMLNSNERVKSSVRDLYLDGRRNQPTPQANATWVTTTDLQGMQNVRFLLVTGFDCFPNSFPYKILGMVYAAVPNLEKIEFGLNLEGERRVEPDALVPLNIPACHLKDIHVNYTNLSIQVINTYFLHAPSLITKLQLHAKDYASYILELLAPLRLPALDTFKLKIYFDGRVTPRTLVSFLAAHPSIRTCTIDSDDQGLDVEETYPRNILPNLSSLRANVDVVHDLLEISGFSSLQLLEINNDAMEDGEDYEEEVTMDMHYVATIKKMVQNFGRLPCLRHFLPWSVDNFEDMMALLKEMTHLAPSLERISFLKVPYSWFNSKEMLRFISVLNSFPELRRLDIFRKDMSQSEAVFLVQQSRSIRSIYIFASANGTEETIIEWGVDEEEISSIRIIDRTLSAVWWKED